MIAIASERSDFPYNVNEWSVNGKKWFDNFTQIDFKSYFTLEVIEI